MRKVLFIVVLLPIAAGVGWWYFGESPFPDYGPSYFAAFLLDPDGNNVEAVCTR